MDRLWGPAYPDPGVWRDRSLGAVLAGILGNENGAADLQIIRRNAAHGRRARNSS